MTKMKLLERMDALRGVVDKLPEGVVVEYVGVGSRDDGPGATATICRVSGIEDAAAAFGHEVRTFDSERYTSTHFYVGDVMVLQHEDKEKAPGGLEAPPRASKPNGSP